MSTNNPEPGRNEALPAPERTEALPAPERTEALPAPERSTPETATEHAEPVPAFYDPERQQAPATTAARPAASTWQPEQEPERVRGPYLAPVILGLVCLAVAGLAFGQEIGNWSIDWGSFGPLGIVAAGAVLVLLGALGLVASRRRS